ncbi:diaminobutyrate acetyltransferase [Halalkalibacter akibai]|uniref:L-2,4-diaminobutyric acid acetyltransferase n=1 Tax=Halalkalibacter akibai (strain ATCC 43226 / DSM 21942 / CIP 109018 / JCM 9157 / 1139) TaxID=1236973 RepID=W4QXP4_HALA3|nr:diaminobutyrate acetyltransferase [Halalkalibacter akibai]GAE36403.1 L-2,4-diaminobutyric acid acetyltransferase [Halalkalibacter akibai JCM 9157]
MTPALSQTAAVEFLKPTVEDGAAMWELVNESTLDQNSAYKYIMMCEFFAETCVVAKENDQLVGFVTAFIPPEKQDVLFIWQVGVDASQRGKGLASKLIKEIVQRSFCDDVTFIEATVTPSNEASQALFQSLARSYHTECEISECFAEDLFPEEGHEKELTFRVGPIKK